MPANSSLALRIIENIFTMNINMDTQPVHATSTSEIHLVCGIIQICLYSCTKETISHDKSDIFLSLHHYRQFLFHLRDSIVLIPFITKGVKSLQILSINNNSSGYGPLGNIGHHNLNCIGVVPVQVEFSRASCTMGHMNAQQHSRANMEDELVDDNFTTP
jgi:hypothetical protein